MKIVSVVESTAYRLSEDEALVKPLVCGRIVAHIVLDVTKQGV